ncbi:MAG: hypothetical protein OEY94_03425 [Alphaproteobacteria bacterium]|nr:hypothetical protein [Alphaproteobacteria bacterium]
MHFIIKICLTAAVFMTLAFSNANAEIFYIEDQDGRFSVSFPDLWRITSNMKPDDQLTVVGPGENNLAVCRVRVREEGRFKIYPQTEYADEIQKLAVSRDFWDSYLGQYDNYVIEAMKDEKGVGRGYASMVEATYRTNEGVVADKHGLMFASLYGDRVYIVECSAQEKHFENWRNAFMGIVKSVDFEKAFGGEQQGHYRDFTDDDSVRIQSDDHNGVYKF